MDENKTSERQELHRKHEAELEALYKKQAQEREESRYKRSDVAEHPVSPRARKWLYVTGGATLVIAIALVIVIGLVRRHHVGKERDDRTADVNAGPRVQVAEVAQSPEMNTIALIGEARPFQFATLYAKISGYLEKVNVDKGDVVKEGQLLAVIRAPETTAQWESARADAANKGRIAKRMKELRKRDLVSAQEEETATSEWKVATGKMRQLAAEKGYEELRAPFDGTITARFADPGALIQNAANSQSSAMAVVTVSQVDQLRIYVYVDQRHALYVKRGAVVELTPSDRPDIKLPATVARLANQLDPSSRTMLVEIDFDNTKNQLIAGSFVQVGLKVPMPTFPMVPVDAVVQKSDKYFAPVVQDNKIHYQEVRPGDNDGAQVQILSGLKPGQIVARNVGFGVPDGSAVRVVKPQEPQKGQPQQAETEKPQAKKAAE